MRIIIRKQWTNKTLNYSHVANGFLLLKISTQTLTMHFYLFNKFSCKSICFPNNQLLFQDQDQAIPKKNSL